MLRYRLIFFLSFFLIGSSSLFSALNAGQTPSPESLIEAEHWKKAKALLESQRRENPGDIRLSLLLARCLERAGDLQGAMELAEGALKRDPAIASSHCLLAYLCGRQVQRSGLIRKALLARRLKKEAEEALRLDPKNEEARMILIEFHRQAPGIVGGDKKTAIRLAEELKAINPVRGFISQAGFYEHEEGGDQKALELLQRAVAADPRSYQARMSLAFFRYRQMDAQLDLAEREAREAIRIDPRRTWAYGVLSRIYARQERWPDLEAVLRDAEANNPDDPAPFFLAGRVALQEGKDYGRAEVYFRRYLAREPELGGPPHAQAHWRLGLVLEKLNRRPEAIESIRTALRLDPSLDNAKKDLKRLER